MKAWKRLFSLLLALALCLTLLPAALAEDPDENAGTIELVEEPPEDAAEDASEGVIAPAPEPLDDRDDPVSYGFKVDDEEITSSNTNAHSTSFSFDGVHTLSVLGDYESVGYVIDDLSGALPLYFGYDAINNYGHDGLIIDFVNRSVLSFWASPTYFENDPCLVHVSRDTVITGGGGGELHANVETALSGASKSAIVVDSNATLTIQNTDLKVRSSYGQAIKGVVNSKLVVDKSRVEIVSGSSSLPAVAGFGGGIELIGCYISYPSGGRLSDDGQSIVKADGSVASRVVIEPTPSVWYDLYVNDVRVTDINQYNVLGDGTFAFDPDTDTLYLKKPSSYTIENMYLIDSQIDGLTVYVERDMVMRILNDDDGYGFICSDGDLTVTGPGKLMLQGPGTGDVGAAIYMVGGDLTLDEARVFCTGMRCGLMGDGGELSFNHSTFYALTMEGGKAICDFAADGITRTDSTYVLPAYTTIKDETGTACNSSDVALEELKLRADSPYSVWIEDVPVTDANKDNILGFTLDTDTWTLFVNYDYTSYDDTVRYLIQSSNAANSLTVVPTKNVTLTGAAAPTIGSTHLIGCAGNLTIQGPYDLTLNCRTHVDGQYTTGVTMLGSFSGSNTLQIVDGSLTIKNATTGIEGRGLGYSALSVENSFLSIQNCTDKAVAIFRNGITLTDCAIVEPSGGQIVNLSTNSVPDYNIVESDGTTVAKTVLIEPSVYNYGVKVDGHEVTDRNRLDVLGDGSGNIAFDGVHTLSVTGMNYTEDIEFFVGENDSGSHTCNDLISNYGHDGLVIDLNEADLFAGNGFHNAWNFYGMPVVIAAWKDTEVTGSGTLEAEYASIDGTCRAVWVNSGKTLTFRDAEVTVRASSEEGNTIGFDGADGAKLVLDNVDMEIISMTAAVDGFTGGIELRNCYIYYPTGGYVSDGKIVDAEGSIAKSVIIKPCDFYGLKIANTEVTSLNKEDVLGDGVFSFDPTTNTLTIHDNYYLDDEDPIIDNYGCDGLVITTEGNVRLSANGNAVIRLTADTTFTGGKLTVDSTNENAILASGSVTLQAAELVLYAEMTYGPVFDYAVMDGGTWLIDNSALHITSSYSSVDWVNIAVMVDHIELQDCYLADPDSPEHYAANQQINNAGTSIVYDAPGTNYDGNYVVAVDIRPGEAPETPLNYGIRVDNTEVNTANQTDVLGNGIFSFDGEHTLSVTGSYTAEVIELFIGGDNFTCRDLISNYGHDGLVIDLNDAELNTATSAFLTGYPCVIAAWENTEVTGSGTLKAEYTSFDGRSRAVWVNSNKTLTFRDADLTVRASSEEGNTIGFDGADGAKLVLDNVDMEIISMTAAVDGFTGGIELRNCYIYYPTGGYVSNGRIVDAEGSIAKTVIIKPVHTHTPGEPVQENYVEPTCTMLGGYDTVVYCTECGEEISREHTEIPALGHLPGEPVQENYVEPTATEEGGYDMVTYCQRCDVELSREHTVLPATLDGFYLIVSQEPIDTGSYANYQESNKFAPNPENEGEYILTTTLALRDHVRVCNVYCGSVSSWYPSSQGNDYRVDADHAGEVTVYFKPTYDSAWADFGGYICIEKNSPAALTVSFDPGTGTGTMEAAMVNAGEEYTLPACTFTHANSQREFYKWSVGGVLKDPNEKITVTADTTVTAMWKYSDNVTVDNSVDRSTTEVLGELALTDTRTGEAANATAFDETTASSFVNPSNPTVSAMINEAKEALLDKANELAGGSPVTVNGSPVTPDSVKITLAVTDYSDERTFTYNDYTQDEAGDYFRNLVIEGQYYKRWEYTLTLEAEYTSDAPLVNPFTDVAEGKYYYDAVLWAYYHDPQITGGTSASTFSPNATCTREQIVTFLWKACGAPEPTTTENPFVDVKEGKYYYKAVLWAVENEVTGGMDATHFGVGRACTREQAMTFLWKAVGAPEPTSTDNPFDDVQEGKYYYKPVLWAVENGITSGMSENTFGVGVSCTRGQIVTFLYAARGFLGA